MLRRRIFNVRFECVQLQVYHFEAVEIRFSSIKFNLLELKIYFHEFCLCSICCVEWHAVACDCALVIEIELKMKRGKNICENPKPNKLIRAKQSEIIWKFNWTNKKKMHCTLWRSKSALTLIATHRKLVKRTNASVMRQWREWEQTHQEVQQCCKSTGRNDTSSQSFTVN